MLTPTERAGAPTTAASSLTRVRPDVGVASLFIYALLFTNGPDAKSLCVLPRGGTHVMLVYASGQCMEQRSCGCSQLWHSAPPGMAVGCC